MTGTLLARIDTPVQGGMRRISLRLKKKSRTDIYYVVVVLIEASEYSGYYQYCDLDLDQYDRLKSAVLAARSAMKNEDKGDSTPEFGTRIDDGWLKISIRVEKRASNSERYAVFSVQSGQVYQFVELDVDELDFFAESILAISAATPEPIAFDKPD